MSDAARLTGLIEKVDKEKQQIFGWASVTTVKNTSLVDLQGDVITEADIESAAYDFMLNSRTAGEMHSKSGIGTLIESMVFTAEKQAALGIDLGKVGWWIGFHVSDQEVWQKVQSGAYRSFSIGGTGVRQPVTGE